MTKHWPEEAPLQLSRNESSYGPLESARKTAEIQISSSNRYPEIFSTRLRQRIADHHAISVDQVFTAAGISSVLRHISSHLLSEKNGVVISRPTFVGYRQEARRRGAFVTEVDVRPNGDPDLERLLASITPSTRLIYLSNPNNPTGSMLRRSELRHFLESVPAHVLPIVDEAYAGYVDHPDYPDCIREIAGEQGRQIGVLRTFSKIYGLAGLRVGYGVFPPALTAALLAHQTPYEITGVAAAAAAASLLDGKEALAQRRAATGRTRRTLLSGLRNLGFDPLPSTANFVQVHVGDGGPDAAALAAHGVLVLPLDDLGAPGSIRITVGTQREIRKLLTVMRDIINEISSR